MVTVPTPRFVALVPAAGKGERFGGEVPKQFVEIAGKSVLAWSVSRLLEAGAAKVIVALAKDRLAWGQTALGALGGPGAVACVIGGRNRQESVAACFAASDPAPASAAGGAEADLLLVHDGARAAVAIDDIRETVQKAVAWGGAVLGRPVADTMKRVEEGRILGTVLRDELFRAETPQVFTREVFARALAKARAEGFVGTDESSLVERLDGVAVAAVLAKHPNPKLTEAGDLTLLEALLKPC
jgi:2-C-methyl-D-erythritol 4-phosphate cytidylyltransferase